MLLTFIGLVIFSGMRSYLVYLTLNIIFSVVGKSNHLRPIYFIRQTKVQSTDMHKTHYSTVPIDQLPLKCT